MKVSSETAVSMPMKNLISIIMAVAVGVWAYFGVQERLNRLETNEELLRKDLDQAQERIHVDLEKNTEFRIKWPRGQLGSLPADSEQFMMIEDLYKTSDKLSKHIDSMALNKVNIEFLTKQMEKVLEDIEELKDGARDMHYKNGNGQ